MRIKEELNSRQIELENSNKKQKELENTFEEKKRELIAEQIELGSKEENAHDKIKKSLIISLSEIGKNKPTPLSFLKARYPFLNGKICVEICGKWHMKIGGSPSDKYPSEPFKLLVEGEEKICFKNATTGEKGIYYNMFYVGESDGNPLVALRLCDNGKFKSVKSNNDNTTKWKKSIKCIDDIFTLKRI